MEQRRTDSAAMANPNPNKDLPSELQRLSTSNPASTASYGRGLQHDYRERVEAARTLTSNQAQGRGIMEQRKAIPAAERERATGKAAEDKQRVQDLEAASLAGLEEAEGRYAELPGLAETDRESSMDLVESMRDREMADLRDVSAQKTALSAQALTKGYDDAAAKVVARMREQGHAPDSEVTQTALRKMKGQMQVDINNTANKWGQEYLKARNTTGTFFAQMGGQMRSLQDQLVSGAYKASADGGRLMAELATNIRQGSEKWSQMYRAMEEQSNHIANAMEFQGELDTAAYIRGEDAYLAPYADIILQATQYDMMREEFEWKMDMAEGPATAGSTDVGMFGPALGQGGGRAVGIADSRAAMGFGPPGAPPARPRRDVLNPA